MATDDKQNKYNDSKAQKYNGLTMMVERRPAYNSTNKKMAAQRLNEVQFFHQTLVQVDSFVHRNRQLLQAS
jgi:hypothetical protein